MVVLFLSVVQGEGESETGGGVPAAKSASSLLGRFKPKATLKTIVAELAAATESTPPLFRPAGGRNKSLQPPAEDTEDDLDPGDAADIFASILAGKSVTVKKRRTTTTTVAPEKTTAKVGKVVVI